MLPTNTWAYTGVFTSPCLGWKNRQWSTEPSYLLSFAAPQTPPSLAGTNVTKRLQSCGHKLNADWSRQVLADRTADALGKETLDFSLVETGGLNIPGKLLCVFKRWKSRLLDFTCWQLIQINKNLQPKILCEKNVHGLPLATGYRSAEERKVPANNTETKQRERERTGGIPGEPGTEQVVATATQPCRTPSTLWAVALSAITSTWLIEVTGWTSDNPGARGWVQASCWESAQTATEEEEEGGQEQHKIKDHPRTLTRISNVHSKV